MNKNYVHTLKCHELSPCGQFFVSVAYETTTPLISTTVPSTRTPVYSKYVCGVKGTSRGAKTLLHSNGIDGANEPHRISRQMGNGRIHYLPQSNHSADILVLGTAVVPIQLENDVLGNLPIKSEPTTDTLPMPVNMFNYSMSNQRRGRVVGGEDGENGEWCWQVALINSMNQYLCGAALIGTQWVLTAAHCVTK